MVLLTRIVTRELGDLEAKAVKLKRLRHLDPKGLEQTTLYNLYGTTPPPYPPDVVPTAGDDDEQEDEDDD